MLFLLDIKELPNSLLLGSYTFVYNALTNSFEYSASFSSSTEVLALVQDLVQNQTH